MSLPGQKLFLAIVVYMLGDFLLIGVSGFLLIPVYVRFMTPAEYGLFATVSTMMTMLGVITQLGLHSAVARFYFLYRERGDELAYLATIWLFQSAFALALGVLLGLWGRPLWRWLSPDVPQHPYLWFVLVGAALSFSAGIYSIWLRVQERPGAFVMVQVLSMAVLLILTGVFLVVLRGGAMGAIGALLGVNLVMSLLTAGLLGRQVEWNFRPGYIKDSLPFGGWMMLGTFGYFLLSRSQLFIVQHYGNLAMVGILNLGLQLGGVVTLVSVSFGKAWQPLIYSACTKEVASRAIAKTAKYYTAGMLYLALTLSVLSREILQILARQMYADAALILRVIAMATFLNALSNLPTTALLYERRADLIQLITLASALANLALNIALIPTWQMIGAAWAMLISFAVLTGGSHILAQRVMRVNYHWADIAKISAMGGVVLAVEALAGTLLAPRFMTLLRLGLLMAFPLALVFSGVFSWREVASVQALGVRYLRRFRHPALQH